MMTDLQCLIALMFPLFLLLLLILMCLVEIERHLSRGGDNTSLFCDSKHGTGPTETEEVDIVWTLGVRC
jgi:hypothetical protein